MKALPATLRHLAGQEVRCRRYGRPMSRSTVTSAACSKILDHTHIPPAADRRMTIAVARLRKTGSSSRNRWDRLLMAPPSLNVPRTPMHSIFLGPTRCQLVAHFAYVGPSRLQGLIKQRLRHDRCKAPDRFGKHLKLLTRKVNGHCSACEAKSTAIA